MIPLCGDNLKHNTDASCGFRIIRHGTITNLKYSTSISKKSTDGSDFDDVRGSTPWYSRDSRLYSRIPKPRLVRGSECHEMSPRRDRVPRLHNQQTYRTLTFDLCKPLPSTREATPGSESQESIRLARSQESPFRKKYTRLSKRPFEDWLQKISPWQSPSVVAGYYSHLPQPRTLRNYLPRLQLAMRKVKFVLRWKWKTVRKLRLSRFGGENQDIVDVGGRLWGVWMWDGENESRNKSRIGSTDWFFKSFDRFLNYAYLLKHLNVGSLVLHL